MRVFGGCLLLVLGTLFIRILEVRSFEIVLEYSVSKPLPSLGNTWVLINFKLNSTLATPPGLSGSKVPTTQVILIGARG